MTYKGKLLQLLKPVEVLQKVQYLKNQSLNMLKVRSTLLKLPSTNGQIRRTTVQVNLKNQRPNLKTNHL